MNVVGQPGDTVDLLQEDINLFRPIRPILKEKSPDGSNPISIILPKGSQKTSGKISLENLRQMFDMPCSIR